MYLCVWNECNVEFDAWHGGVGTASDPRWNLDTNANYTNSPETMRAGVRKQGQFGPGWIARFPMQAQPSLEGMTFWLHYFERNWGNGNQPFRKHIRNATDASDLVAIGYDLASGSPWAWIYLYDVYGNVVYHRNWVEPEEGEPSVLQGNGGRYNNDWEFDFINWEIKFYVNGVWKRTFDCSGWKDSITSPLFRFSSMMIKQPTNGAYSGYYSNISEVVATLGRPTIGYRVYGLYPNVDGDFQEFAESDLGFDVDIQKYVDMDLGGHYTQGDGDDINTYYLAPHVPLDVSGFKNILCVNMAVLADNSDDSEVQFVGIPEDGSQLMALNSAEDINSTRGDKHGKTTYIPGNPYTGEDWTEDELTSWQFGFQNKDGD